MIVSRRKLVADTIISLVDIESYSIFDIHLECQISTIGLQYPMQTCHPSSAYIHSSGCQMMGIRGKSKFISYLVSILHIIININFKILKIKENNNVLC